MSRVVVRLNGLLGLCIVLFCVRSCCVDGFVVMVVVVVNVSSIVVVCRIWMGMIMVEVFG